MMKTLRTAAITLATLLAAIAFVACSNTSDVDDIENVAQTQLVTTTTTTTTTSAPATTTTTTTSEITTTTAPTVTTTTEPTTTTKKQTTTEKKKATTTAKQTTAKKTTTTAKKTTTTTTTKKQEDDKYKMTGLMASYDRLRRGVPTEADKQAIIDDLCDYLLDNFQGKSGEITIHRDGTIQEAMDYFGGRRRTTTLNVETPLNFTVDKSYTFEKNACLNNSTDNQCMYNPNGESAEEAYLWTLKFMSDAYSMAEVGVSCAYKGYEWDDYADVMGSLRFYFSIDNANFSSSEYDIYYIWFLTET